MALTYFAPTPLAGMGAIVQGGGVSFRVWAPNARGVTLGGDFLTAGATSPTNWEELAMARDSDTGEGGAYWSIFVKDAVADTLYKFKIDNPNVPSETAGNGYWPYRHDPYAKDATSVGYYGSEPGNSVVVDDSFDWSGDNFQMPGWNELVVYEVHLGTLTRDASGAQGNLEDATGRLQYIADLGFSAITIMPAFDFDSETSMGYNPALPFAMANAYGTLSAMKSFIKKAHQLGIAVILDVVYNHFGPGLDSCLNNFDGTTNPGWQGIYFYQDDRINTPFGSRPDFGRPEVRQYIFDNAVNFCLGELHADGLRFDSTIGIRHNVGPQYDMGPNEEGRTLLRWIGEGKRSSQPWKILVAEDLQNDTQLTQDALFGGIGLDSQWDPWYLSRMQQMMFAPSDPERRIGDVADAVRNSYNNAGPYQRVIYLESHDQCYQKPRIPDRIMPGDAEGYFARKRATLGAALLMTSAGIPMIFMGQEFMEYKPWNDGGSYLDWDRTTSFGGIVAMYRRLAHLRRNFDNNTRGLRGGGTQILWADAGTGILVFHRWDNGGPGDDVIVVANLSNTIYDSYNIGFPAWGNWYLRFNSGSTQWWSDFHNIAYDTFADNGGNMGQGYSGNVGIDAYAVLIYSQ